MKYLLAIAVFVAGAMFPFALWAQSFQVISGSSWESFHGHDSGFYQPYHGRSRDVVFPPFFGYPSNYPFEYFYPGLWPPLSYEYRQASEIAHGNVEAEVEAQQNAYLSSQIQALTDEVRSLREKQASREYVQPPSPPPESSAQMKSGAQQELPAVVFVYRDGRHLEARNYAIFGKTLWIFHADTTQKIPLTDFNLAASRKLNEERGVEFPLSSTH